MSMYVIMSTRTCVYNISLPMYTSFCVRQHVYTSVCIGHLPPCAHLYTSLYVRSRAGLKRMRASVRAPAEGTAEAEWATSASGRSWPPRCLNVSGGVKADAFYMTNC